MVVDSFENFNDCQRLEIEILILVILFLVPNSKINTPLLLLLFSCIILFLIHVFTILIN